MTFLARFETVDLSDIFLSFLGLLMKRDGSDGEIKGRAKGTKGVRRTKEKRGWPLLKKADERMERWLLSFSMLFPTGEHS